MDFVLILSCFLAVLGMVMLLLWGIERFEMLLRRRTPRFFNGWLQLHCIAVLVFLVACVIVWPGTSETLTVEFLVVPAIAASLAYLAPLVFAFVALIHNPDTLLALAASGFRYLRQRVRRWLRGSPAESRVDQM